ncbi:hypothetical protein B0J13DRAFT_593707 [Dactylonectria estremocensis]|uniref:Uncharacterized protein n=1 Tax=Dactylonectria estremocensis TaxID=1079267 RepID=A0A9P9JCJ5_9HYPO|nr:hypothetical protein B0J13DRAFT_593707 [Dactylonectria estremocensis]
MELPISPSAQRRKPKLSAFTPKQLRRFYEPIVLFKALNDISRESGRIRSPERYPNLQTDEDKFQSFLDKLALVCDRTKGGSTVTAVTVLDEDDSLKYIFGCNQLSAAKLDATTGFLQRLLRKTENFHRLKPIQKPGVQEEIRNLVLAFNRRRIEQYIIDLQKELGTCIESCSQIDYNDMSTVETSLKELALALGTTIDKKADEAEYLDICLHCLREIHAFKKATTDKFIDERATEGRLPDHKSMFCWSELRHNLSRLLAYEVAVETFIATEANWPELFQETTVKPVPSSRPDSNPLGKKSEEARNIIGRLDSDPLIIENYRNLASRLEGDPYLLNERIKKQCMKDSFRPIVHCEILVLNWVLVEYKEPSFFQNRRYIGTSKGSCKLCHRYVEAHPSTIKMRSTHGNVYANWKFPDLVKTEGNIGHRERQNMFNSMINAVRKDAFFILEEKAPTGKSHDSNTYTFVSHPEPDVEAEAGGSDTSEVDELAERLEAGLGFTNMSTKGSLESFDSDDEEGGTSLF